MMKLIFLLSIISSLFFFSCTSKVDRESKLNDLKLGKNDSIVIDTGNINDFFETTVETKNDIKTSSTKIIRINEQLRFGNNGADSTYVIIEKAQNGKLPNSIFKFKKMRSIDFASIGIDSINYRIGELIHVERIIGYNNNISELPYSFSNMSNLKELNLDGNSIREFPKNISSMDKLEVLFIGDNKISAIPDEIGELIYLKEIQLNGNKIKELPESFYKLKNLAYCYLSNNQIETIDKRILDMEKLELLNLNNNRLSSESKRILDELKSNKPEIKLKY